jgi:hypothetical protein
MTRRRALKTAFRLFTASTIASALAFGGLGAAQADSWAVLEATNYNIVEHWGTQRYNLYSCNYVQMQVLSSGAGSIAIGLRRPDGIQYARASGTTIVNFPWVSFTTDSGSPYIPIGAFYINSRTDYVPMYWKANFMYSRQC